MATFPESAPRQQFVGEIQKSGIEPERVTLFVNEVPKLTDAEIAAGIEFIDGRFDSGDLQRYGADPTGVIDATSAINSALIVGSKTNGPLVTGEGTYLISSKITIMSDADFANCQFNASGIGTGIAVEISTGSATDPLDRLHRKHVVLPKLNNDDKPGTGWAAQGTGVRCVNLVNCHVKVPQIEGFDTGLHVSAFTVGNAYNNYEVYRLGNNKVQCKVMTGNAAGWCNQNTFLGSARGQIDSGEGSNISGCRHIQILPYDTTDASANWPNNNLFLNWAIEGDGPEYDLEVSGQQNIFIGLRPEGTPKIEQVGHSSESRTFDNVFISGFAMTGVTWSTTDVVGRTFQFGRECVFDGDGVTVNLGNTSSSTAPQLQGFPSGVRPLGKTSSDTDWTYRLAAHKLEGKGTAETGGSRITVDFTNGEILLGANAAPDVSLQRRAANKWGLGSGDGLCLGNSGANTNTIPAASDRSVELFDESGASIGFVALHTSNW